jgi:hypothetical protein
MLPNEVLGAEGPLYVPPFMDDLMEEILLRENLLKRKILHTILPLESSVLKKMLSSVNVERSLRKQLLDMKATGGPGFEQYFRNAALLVMEHPESGNTLLDISRVFSDKDYRDYKLSKCKNPLLNQFWANAEKTTGEQGLQNWTQYVNSKFDIFMSNDIMRPIVAQEKSAFNFREIMDTKKIFLANLSKGRLGENMLDDHSILIAQLEKFNCLRMSCFAYSSHSTSIN